MYKGLLFCFVLFLDYGHVECPSIESLTEKRLDLPFDLETCPCRELCRGEGLLKDDIESTVPPMAAFKLCSHWPVVIGNKPSLKTKGQGAPIYKAFLRAS